MTVSSFGRTTSRNLSIACRSSSALGFLQFLYAVEDFAEIARRINRQLVADFDLEFARQLHPESAESPSRSSAPFLMNFCSGTTFSSSAGSIPRIMRRQAFVLEFDDHRALHVGRGADDARRIPDFHREIAPIAQDILAC